MKTYEIKDLLKKDLLIVELPENKDIDFYEHGRELLLLTKGYIQLGKSDEIEEEDAKAFVDRDKSVMFEYKNYNGGKRFLTALESFFSALEKEIYWENPINVIPRGEASEHDRVKNQNEFNEAQEKTFDRNRSILLFKN